MYTLHIPTAFNLKLRLVDVNNRFKKEILMRKVDFSYRIKNIYYLGSLVYQFVLLAKFQN